MLKRHINKLILSFCRKRHAGLRESTQGVLSAAACSAGCCTPNLRFGGGAPPPLQEERRNEHLTPP